MDLKQIFYDHGQAVSLTANQANDIVKYVQRYEVRGENMLAFNSPMLGIHRALFLGKDSDAIFDISNIDKHSFARDIKACSGINSQFNVVSNDFNLLVVWLVYRLGAPDAKPKLSAQQIYNTRFALLKLLHYKFFTGKVATMFKHGVSEGVMQYTIDNLTAKSDIKRQETATWRLLIESHVRAVLEPGGIHSGTISTFSPDKNVAYLLSDTHTRISTKIVNIAQEYYNNHAAGNSIGTTSMIGENSEGEKVLKALKATLDNTIINVQQAALNINTWLNHNDVKLSAGIANVRPDILRDILTIFSNVATQQTRVNLDNEVKYDKQKNKLYVGYKILLSELIQKTYRRCAMMGCDMKSNVQILEKARDAYRASRILDPDILCIKNSLDHFIHTNTKYHRESLAVACRTAMIMYIMIQSFKHN